MSSVTAASDESTVSTQPELPSEAAMYRALCERDADFLGLFVAGIRTTGIVCLPTCPARKPRPENVVYFATTADALHAGSRACKRCRPLDAPRRASAVVERLLAALDAHPEQPLRAAELRAMGIEPATARRHFCARFGMSFAAYGRVRRLGQGLRELRAGSDVIECQLAAGFASGSGFPEALLRDLGHPPRDARQPTLLLARFKTSLSGSGRWWIGRLRSRRGAQGVVARTRAPRGHGSRYEKSSIESRFRQRLISAGSVQTEKPSTIALRAASRAWPWSLRTTSSQAAKAGSQSPAAAC